MVLVQKIIKKIYLGAKWWWTPWSDTLAYYPLTSTSTTSDMKWSGTAYDLSNVWWVTFWTYQGVDCANMTWWSDYLQNTNVSVSSWANLTFSLWCYITGSNNYNLFFGLWYSRWDLYSWWYHNSLSWYWTALCIWELQWWAETIATYSSSLINWRHLITCTYWWWVGKLYCDWTYFIQYNTSIWNVSWLYLWVNPNSTNENYIWYMSEFILENKVWTADEIAEYYNDTKSLYWIS